MQRVISIIVAAALAGSLAAPAAELAATITVDAAKPGQRINPAMWGVFFEDINFGGDGGLHAELVKNRSFEFTEPLMGWTVVPEDRPPGSHSVREDDPLHLANPRYVRLAAGPALRGLGLINEGFRGMGIRQGETYNFSVYARTKGAAAPESLRVTLLSAAGATLDSASVSGFAAQWKMHTASLRASATDPKARLSITLQGAGTIDLDMISLYPARTWKDRPRGLRADLIQMLADLKPGFVRFPGGCIVEGRRLPLRYQWKKTIGDHIERPTLINRWNDEFAHRPTPDYFQSFGLGFFEFFQICEDIGAEPLPILNCGMACQFNSGELAPLGELEPYIQDALDLIEFANGPASSAWGSRRAAMGHPDPFRMKLLGIGNEQWGPQYIERYERFAAALKARHPEIKLIASAGPRPDDDLYRFLWSKLPGLPVDIVDEHCYATPDWFFKNASRYDAFDRSGPKVFMGEYAAQSVKVVSPDNRNDWGCALAEAAYMIGLERNADVVVMASYAPLFAHADAWQWKPNLIWCDNLAVYGTPSYHVQKLFCHHRGDTLLPTKVAVFPAPAAGSTPNLFASATRDEKAGEIVLKVVNAAGVPARVLVKLDGAKDIAPRARAIVLTSPRLSDENAFEAPAKVSPMEEPFDRAAPSFPCGLNPYSLTVLRLRHGGR